MIPRRDVENCCVWILLALSLGVFVFGTQAIWEHSVDRYRDFLLNLMDSFSKN